MPGIPVPRYPGYGWLPDLPDSRDWTYASIARLRGLPRRVDLRSTCSPIEDQGELGSCTANALAGALEYLETRSGVRYEDVSRLFIYYNERVIEHTVNSDSGAMLRDGIKTLVKQGACNEALWPYDIRRFTVKPTPACYRDALNHQVTSYRRIANLAEMRACLASGFPFVFGFVVYESFESARVAKTGVAPMPGRGERALGGHAVMAVGYDDRTKRFTVRNSWGTRWGQKGYFTLPYAYLDNPNLARDFWTIRASEGYSPPGSDPNNRRP
jgi:C1A family cysteine protease